MELIDKAAIVAEMEKYKVRAKPSYYGCGRVSVCEDLINFINTLEVKEVNLETELSNYIEHYRNRETGYTIFGIAKHFFELGLKAKGEQQ